MMDSDSILRSATHGAMNNVTLPQQLHENVQQQSWETVPSSLVCTMNEFGKASSVSVSVADAQRICSSSHPFSARFGIPWSPSNMSDDNGDLHLFSLDRIHRKRKAPSFSEICRPSKVLITEATKDLDSLHIGSSPTQLDIDIAVEEGLKSTEPKTWAEFHAAEMMEIDELPARKITPQLEMSESLKEAIRLAELAEESAILPGSVINEIINPIHREPCMAIVPYRPRELLELLVPPGSSVRRSIKSNEMETEESH